MNKSTTSPLPVTKELDKLRIEVDNLKKTQNSGSTPSDTFVMFIYKENETLRERVITLEREKYELEHRIKEQERMILEREKYELEQERMIPKMDKPNSKKRALVTNDLKEKFYLLIDDGVTLREATAKVGIHENTGYKLLKLRPKQKADSDVSPLNKPSDPEPEE